MELLGIQCSELCRSGSQVDSSLRVCEVNLSCHFSFLSIQSLRSEIVGNKERCAKYML